MPVQAVLAVIASFLAILVGICVVFLNKYLDVLIVPRNYIFWFRLPSNMRDLKVNMEDLSLKKEDIDKKIAEGERQSKSPVSQVEGWKGDVDAIMPEIKTILDEYEGCRHNRGFFSIRSNYLDSIKCADYLEKVKDLLKRGEFDVVTMDDVSNFTIPTSYEVPGSLERNCKAVEFVLNDNSTNVIGIWGMGGVGKTTLLKKVHNLCIQHPAIFDHVIWIVASSQQSNTSKVQSEIVKKLKLNETDDIQSQALIIHKFLKNKNFLLFIDDLWERVELVEVGIPNTSDRECAKKRKVVFTTREMYVCGNMEVKETIKVNCLNWEESWLLFKEKVGEQVIQSHPGISKLAEDVAKECKGLPLALITIGRAMSTKKNSNEWKSALNLMRKSQAHDISGIKKDEMQRILKISYDFLDKDLKKCFLSISMWPEDYIISHYEMIECWMGLDIIDNFESMEEAYAIGTKYIRDLQAACLLENAEYVESFKDKRDVKMHDVLRDLSIWIASDCGENKNKRIIKAGISSYKGSNIKLKWSEAECISLMVNDITELPLGITCCPDLHTLMLSRNNLTCESILNCFHNFHSLKYLDLFANKLNGFPESICTLTELQYLNLSRNNIVNIPEKLRNLKELKYLKLGDNPIRKVPRGVFSELGKLLLLDLFSEHENIYGPDVEELKCLEKKLLYLGITVRPGEELNKLMLLSDFHIVALCIKDLNNTSFHFVSIIQKPCTSNLKNYLVRLSIAHSHHSLLEIVFDKDGNQDYSLNVKDLNFICLLTLRRIIWRGLAPKKLFPFLRQIKFIRCSVLKHVTWIIHLPSLERLRINECNSMRIAFSNNNYEVDSSDSTFPSLKILAFGKMPNLQKLSSRFSPAFPQLRILEVVHCPLVKTLERELKASPKIQEIWGNVELWGQLEWENDNSRSHFSQFFGDQFLPRRQLRVNGVLRDN